MPSLQVAARLSVIGIGSRMARDFFGNGSVKSEKDFIYCTAKSSEESNVRYFAENGIICVEGTIFVTDCCEILK